MASKKKIPCPRCDARGFLPQYFYNRKGICFRCWGGKYVLVKIPDGMDENEFIRKEIQKEQEDLASKPPKVPRRENKLARGLTDALEQADGQRDRLSDALSKILGRPINRELTALEKRLGELGKKQREAGTVLDDRKDPHKEKVDSILKPQGEPDLDPKKLFEEIEQGAKKPESDQQEEKKPQKKEEKKSQKKEEKKPEDKKPEQRPKPQPEEKPQKPKVDPNKIDKRKSFIGGMKGVREGTFVVNRGDTVGASIKNGYIIGKVVGISHKNGRTKLKLDNGDVVEVPFISVVTRDFAEQRKKADEEIKKAKERTDEEFHNSIINDLKKELAKPSSITEDQRKRIINANLQYLDRQKKLNEVILRKEEKRAEGWRKDIEELGYSHTAQVELLSAQLKVKQAREKLDLINKRIDELKKQANTDILNKKFGVNVPITSTPMKREDTVVAYRKNEKAREIRGQRNAQEYNDKENYFKTRKEARQWFAKNFIRPGFEANLKALDNVDLKVASGFARVFDQISKDFPMLKNNFTHVFLEPSSGGIHMAASRLGIHFYEGMDGTKFSHDTVNGYVSGWSMLKTPYDIYIHEIGHLLDRVLEFDLHIADDGSRSYRKNMLYSKRRNDFFSKSGLDKAIAERKRLPTDTSEWLYSKPLRKYADALSIYGFTSREEIFAEAFADLYNGEQKSLTKEFKKFLNEAIKEYNETHKNLKIIK